MRLKAGGRLLLFLLLSPLFLRCGTEAAAVLLEDSYWSVSLRTSPGAETLLRDVKNLSGFRVSFLTLPAGAPAAELLAAYLDRERPAAVIVGAFIALELQSLAERYADIRFICLDAPPEPPAAAPYVWVRFNPRPALREAAEKVREFLESSGGAPRRKPAAFLDAGMGGMFAAAAAEAGLAVDRVDIPAGYTTEELKAVVRGQTEEPPPLVALFAGTHNAGLVDLLRQGGPIPIVTAGRGNFPETESPFFALSVEKDYAGAIAEALKSGAKPGSVLDVPMKLEGKLFDKGNR